MKILKALLLIILMSACCKSNLIDTIRFAESDLIVNPYSGNETLKFLDDSNNVINYNNGYRATTEEEVKDCKGGCCDHYLVEQFNRTIYESSYMKSNLQIIISNSFDLYSGKKGIPNIHFNWDYYEIKPYVSGTTFGSLPVGSMQQTGIEQGIYRDSLVLRDQKYYNIYTLPGRCTYEDRLYGDTLFYSETDGIIGLKFTDGNLWTKI